MRSRVSLNFGLARIATVGRTAGTAGIAGVRGSAGTAVSAYETPLPARILSHQAVATHEGAPPTVAASPHLQRKVVPLEIGVCRNGVRETRAASASRRTRERSRGADAYRSPR